MPYKPHAPVKMDVEGDKAAGGYTRTSPGTAPSTLSRYQTFLFAITCAMAVANVYFAQPLLESMAASLSVSPGTIGIVVTDLSHALSFHVSGRANCDAHSIVASAGADAGSLPSIFANTGSEK